MLYRKPSSATLASAENHDLSPASIRIEMDRIQQSSVFTRSERMKRFLRLIVERALGDELGGLKESTIAIAVFDKPASFDPRLDPIVRVEAGRLRAKLREYYEAHGKDDPVRIGISRRGYVPIFALGTRPEDSPDKVGPAAGNGVEDSIPEPRRTVAVLPFQDLSRSHDQEYLCDGLTEEIVSVMSRVNGLRVVARTSTMQFKDAPADVRQIGAHLNAGNLLEGSIRISGGRIRISARLIDAVSGCHLWSDAYERELNDLLEVQVEIAGVIAGAVGKTLVGEGS